MADKFDPYHVWLGIPPAEQPAHHYRLLGIGLFENDPDVIEGAADRQMAHVQKHKIGAHSADSQRLLNELAKAKLTLMHAGKKADYDRMLQARRAPQSAAAPAPVQAAPVHAAQARSVTSSSQSQPVSTVRQVSNPQPAGNPQSRATLTQDFTSEHPAASRSRKPAKKKSQSQLLFYVLPVVLLAGVAGAGFLLRGTTSPPSPPLAAKVRASRDADTKSTTDPVKTESQGATKASHSSVKRVAAPPENLLPADPREPSQQPATQPGMAVPPPAAVPSAAASPPPTASSLSPAGEGGQWVDLLASFRFTRANRGDWQLSGGPQRVARVKPHAQEHARFMLPVVPPREYVLEAEVTPDEQAEVGFGLVSGSSRFLVNVDGWGQQMTAFDLVDGKSGNAIEYAPHVGPLLTPKTPSLLRFEVRSSGVTVDCDGRRVLDWGGGLDRLRASEIWNMTDPRKLFLTDFGAPYKITRLRLQSLSGEPALIESPRVAVNVAVPAAPAGAPPAGGDPPPPASTARINARRVAGSDGILKPSAPVKVLQETGNAVSCAAISPEGEWAVSSSQGGANLLWDVRKGVQAGGLDGNETMQRAAFTPDRRYLVTVSAMNIFVWDLKTGQLARKTPLPQASGQVCVGLAPDGRTAACAENQNHAMNFLDALTGEVIYRADDLPDVSQLVALSPGSKLAFVFGLVRMAGNNNAYTHKTRLYDLKAKRPLTTGPQTQQLVQAAAFSGDGSRLAYGEFSSPSRIQVWNLAKNELQLTLTTTDAGPTSLAFTPDGRRLLGNTSGGTSVRVWDAQTGEALAEFPGHERVVALQTTADGRLALSADSQGAVRLWRMPGGAGPAPLPTAAPTTAPPDFAAQQKAAALIKDVYADDFTKAKKPAEKLALAEKLLRQAEDSQDLSEKYVLMVKARDLAREAGEPLVFLQAVEALGGTFALDMFDMALTGAEALARENLAPKARHDLAEGLVPLVDRALAGDKYEEARKLLNAAQAAARKTNDLVLVKSVTARLAEVAELKKQAEGLKVFEEALARNPADPAANLALGKFYCLTKDDWGRGLPLLAKGGDDSFGPLAAQEIADPRESADQLKLADGWYALGEAASGRDKTRLLLHAETWYNRVLPSVAGLTQTKVSKRLEEIAALRPADAGETAAVGDKAGAAAAALAAKPLSLRIKNAVKKENYTSTSLAGQSRNAGKFVEVPPAGGLLIGFNYTADPNNNDMISSIQAIYQTGKSTVEGTVWGQVRGNPGTITAKKGYAVGGVKVSTAPYVAGFDVIFPKVDRGMLDPKDQYTSPRIGSTLNFGNLKNLGGDGQPVIGIFGFTNDYNVYGLGLVQLPGQ